MLNGTWPQIRQIKIYRSPNIAIRLISLPPKFPTIRYVNVHKRLVHYACIKTNTGRRVQEEITIPRITIIIIITVQY